MKKVLDKNYLGIQKLSKQNYGDMEFRKVEQGIKKVEERRSTSAWQLCFQEALLIFIGTNISIPLKYFEVLSSLILRR